MKRLCQRIGYIKRKFTEIAILLDEVYKELQETKEKKKEELKELEKKCNKQHSAETRAMDNLINKIKARMRYLYRSEDSLKHGERLEELAKILDWIQQST